LIDKDIVLDKASKVDRHLRRVKEKRVVNLQEFLSDLDRQESVLFNLQMALQHCIDVAAHIISDEELGIAGSTSELFYMLQQNSCLTPELTEKMVGAVGFRNLVVHEYGNIDLKEVYRIAHENIDDIETFIKTILTKCGVA
jgi:uncharacterized protein YutE (UPF0331/DUF86 family)